MSKNLRQCMKTMHLFCDTKCPKLKKSLLNEMSKKDSFFKAIYEIVHNIKIEKLKLKASEKVKLRKYVKLLESILKKPKCKKKKQKYVKQFGGALFSFLLPVLSSVVASLFGNAVS